MTTPGGNDDRRIYLDPAAPDVLRDAVTAAGGTLTADPGAASAIVWYGADPDQFAEVDHDGIDWVQLPSAGVEDWIATVRTRAGRTFTTATGCYADAVAEHALGLLLIGVRRMHDAARARSWGAPDPGTLAGRAVGIVGAGGIGRSLIRLLRPFGVTVWAVTRTGREVPGAERSLDPTGLPELLAGVDHVVLALPATADTARLIGPGELELMRPHAWLVNVARGSLIDTDALVAALRTGGIAGAALDVTDPEPLPDDHPLWSEPRAVITPHCANPEQVLLPRLAERVRRNVRAYLDGTEFVGVLDPVSGY